MPQGATTSVPFLLFNPSPEGNGQGAITVARMSDDPYAVISNPAHLGMSSAQTNVAFGFYLTKSSAPLLFGLEDFSYNATVVSCGLNLGEWIARPLSIGIAYSRVKLDLGTYNRTGPSRPEVIGTFDMEEHADAISIGAGVDLGVRLALGMTFRRIISNLAPFGAGNEAGSGSAKAWSYDYGLLLDIPVPRILKKDPEIFPGIVPVFDVSLGTALTNVGGKLVYIDPAQGDPLPRAISLGATIELGIELSRTGHKLLTFAWSRQSDVMLAARDTSGLSYYLSEFGDLNLLDNFVKGRRSKTVSLSNGWEIGIAEMIFVRGGSSDGMIQRSFSASGIGIRASGFFKLLQGLGVSGSEALSWIISHLDVRYDQSEYDVAESSDPPPFTKYSSLAIVIKL